MLTFALIALSLALLAWAVRRGRARDRAAARADLLRLAVALVVGRALLELARSPWAAGAAPALFALAAAAGLLGFGALARLTFFTRLRRDDWLRAPLVGIALLLAAGGAPWGLSQAIAVSVVLSFRWIETFDTRARFRLLVLALALGVVLAWPLARGAVPPPPAGSWMRALRDYGQWVSAVGFFYVAFAVPALFVAFTRDPSLGIRRVSWRLALSHVLVGAVPFGLLLLLWGATTYLGVNADRALIATRQIASEGDRFERALRAALDGPDTPRAGLRALAAAHADEWPGLGLWLSQHRRLERVRGDAVPGERALAEWAGALGRLPGSGVVQLEDGRYFGAAARAGRDSSLSAVALVPIQQALDGGPARAVEARLRLVGRPRWSGDDSLAGARAPGAPPATALGAEDSAALARARAVARRFGIADSVVQASGRRPSGTSVTFKGDTIATGVSAFDRGALLAGGGAIMPGLQYESSGWAERSFLLTARVRLGRALTGLVRNRVENPVSWVPLLLLAALALAFLFVIGVDLAMVRGMGRSTTAAIAALRGGTEALEEGRLEHRIEVAGEDDLWAVAARFNDMATGLERARAREEERLRIENELALARRIHARLLPAAPPTVRGLEIAGRSESAREVGGDYYDHIVTGPDRVLLVVADVSGKGVPAALLMSGFRAALLSQDLARPEPAPLVGRLNTVLHRSVDPGKFVTAFVGFLDGTTGRLAYSNAGHNPPAVMRADGSVEWLSAGGLVLGVMEDSRFESGETTLEPGDLVALYTDGVTEGAGDNGEMWGEERLVAALRDGRAAGAPALADAIVTAVRGFEGARGPADDITVLVARRVPGPGA
ncbi:MAG: hypothetical protein A2W00_08830 [Candidatus Eisenbacteria bacterium RBG_16_71_46]|nr:MAG: hypothetical protein A2W00_08830 [Candidatus Eisenbacteria bacterium RBG_16_71_46]